MRDYTAVVKFTKEGFKKMQGELADIIAKRPQVLARMVAAREQGDLSENAGYHASKDELSKIDRRIRELKYLIRTGQIVDRQTDDQVGIGSVVKVKNDEGEFEYKIVGQLEADPASGRLSVVSPVGSALLGKKTGDEVDVETPGRKVVFKIVEIK